MSSAGGLLPSAGCCSPTFPERSKSSRLVKDIKEGVNEPERTVGEKNQQPDQRGASCVSLQQEDVQVLDTGLIEVIR